VNDVNVVVPESDLDISPHTQMLMDMTLYTHPHKIQFLFVCKIRASPEERCGQMNEDSDHLTKSHVFLLTSLST